ncbi:MAG: ATP-dependent RNA helicase HrpA [Pirellulaceae bacterium]
MLSTLYRQIETKIDQAMKPEQFRLRRRLKSLRKKGESSGSGEQLKRLASQVERSVVRRQQREAALPSITYDESLPIHARREDIAQALREHPVIIVCGETGSGKSTQLPKICLEMGRGVDGFIGHTQPRRLAARSIATRLAEEIGAPLGQDVGFKIRFTDRTRPETYVKLMTDGILLAETPQDRFLNQYDTIILDEAHERSLNVDFLLGYIKRLLPKRPELRCIITSATIDAERFSQHFSTARGPAPIIEVSGRSYPVEVRYRPPEANDEAEEPETADQIVAAVGELTEDTGGDILVFLPTERDIRETAAVLNRRIHHFGRPQEVLPLYARLPTKEQNRVFAPDEKPRVVLATNVAESSLTVPRIRGVVDTGTARISRYSPRSKVQRLPIESVSQASADQRKGRCGRIGPGICVRLYREEDYLARDRYATPEIRRTNLASVILQTMALKLGEIDEFPFLDPPRPEAIRDGYKTLFELGAIDHHRKLTPIGRELSRLPVDPRIGRMILAGDEHRCLEEVLIIAAGLEVQDPRERPAEKAQLADQCHAQFADPRSDFFSILRLWDFYHHLRETLSKNQLRKACRQNFLSYNRLREWADIYRQLRQLVEESGRKRSPRRDDYDAVHKSLLTGLLSSIAYRGDTYEYTGAGGKKLHLWPGSVLFEDRPKWVVAAELVETSRRYGRVVGRINPRWIEPLAEHLVSRSHSEPHWDRRSGSPMAIERVSLFGLLIVPRRRVPLGPIDPDTARQLFIQHALVEEDVRDRLDFLDHNRGVLREIEELAAKQRRGEWIVGQRALFQYYDRRLPPDIHDMHRLKQWLKKERRRNPAALCMCREDVLPASEVDPPADQFPDTLNLTKTPLPLDYRYAPGEADDGVTVTVPQHAINHLSHDQIDWLVPGRLEEKITALIRALPKSLRRCLVPAPDTARRAARELKFGRGPFLPTLAQVLERISGETIPPDAFQLDRLPVHLAMKVRVVDDNGETLAVDNSLERLRESFGVQSEGTSGQITDSDWDRPPTTDWNFGELPEEVTVTRGGLRVPAYPAVVDQEENVAVRLVDTPDRAHHESRRGIRRLYYLSEKKSLFAHVAWLPRINETKLLASTLLPGRQLDTELALLIAERAFLGEEPLPRSESVYRQRLTEAAERANVAVQQIAPLIHPLFQEYHAARLALEDFPARRFSETAEDVRRQLAELMPANFLTVTPWCWLEHFPRYLKAISNDLISCNAGGSPETRKRSKSWRPGLTSIISGPNRIVKGASWIRNWNGFAGCWRSSAFRSLPNSLVPR